MNSSLWIAAGLALCAAIVAVTQLPRHSPDVAAPHGTQHHHHHQTLVTSEAARSN